MCFALLNLKASVNKSLVGKPISTFSRQLRFELISLALSSSLIFRFSLDSLYVNNTPQLLINTILHINGFKFATLQTLSRLHHYVV